MQPHLVRWQTQANEAGQPLRVVYVARGGALSSEAAARDAMSWPFPVLHDTTGQAVRDYGVRAYPTAYILDRSGRVVWEGVPVYNPAEVEQQILQAVRNTGP